MPEFLNNALIKIASKKQVVSFSFLFLGLGESSEVKRTTDSFIKLHTHTHILLHTDCQESKKKYHHCPSVNNKMQLY